MSVSVRTVVAEHSYRKGRGTLVQRFEFEGTSAAELITVVLGAPLVGHGSIFGPRPGRTGERTPTSWHLHGFSPVPGFRFDVGITDSDGSITVHFSQPERSVPFLSGDALWTIADKDSSTIFDEQINTTAALDVVASPLSGERPSLRRRLFFVIGHRRVMAGATANLVDLLND